LNEEKSFKMLAKQKYDASSLIVVWNQDIGRLGQKVAAYLSKHLKCHPLAEISPEGFFSLSGVTVENDVAQFPKSRFYGGTNKSVVVLESDVPRSDWFGFIKLVLDIAEKKFGVKEIFTVGGMVLPGAHTAPLTLLSVVNSARMKKALSSYDIDRDMNYETRDGQRPTFSSYLVWAAKTRNIPATCLWVPVPFYLMTLEDPQACRKILELLNDYLDLRISFADIDDEVIKQNLKIARVRRQVPELDGYISKLENNLGLTADEGEKLVKELDVLLRSSHDI
jgi:predicted ATP-grasp superfamily ATP-dependent carboligase